MKKFAFSLERVTQYRQQEKRLKEIELGHCKRRLDEALQDLQGEQQSLDELLDLRDSKMISLNPDVIQSHQYLIGRQVEMVEISAKHADAVRQDWLAAKTANQIANTDFEILENLKEEKHQEFLVEVAKNEFIAQGENYLRKWALEQGKTNNG